MSLKDTYAGKTVLVTGHTGFKGSWLSIWLNELGAKVIGYSLDPKQEEDNFNLTGLKDRIIDIRGDLNDLAHLEEVFRAYEPDYVFHLAAQPLVRDSYEMPVYTFDTNVLGTVHVLECIRHLNKPCIGIMITTDKVYENNEDGHPFREDDKFGGYDPYSASKACCEIAIASYRRSFMNPENYPSHHKTICSVRAGNVIGGGDFAKDRIVPDCIRALQADKPIVLRSPDSVRPFQHVLEPLYGYLLLGERCAEDPVSYACGYNFGPDSDTVKKVREVAEEIVKYYGKGEIVLNVDPNAPHEAKLLLLDTAKVKEEIGWKPALDFEKTIAYTCSWYRDYKNEDVYQLCVKQIEDYMKEIQNGIQ